MSNSDLDFKKIKEEADQVLFEELQFNEALKEKVRKKRKFYPSNKWKRPLWVKPFVMVAAVFTAVFISAMMLLDKPKTEEISMHQTFLGGEGDSNLISESAMKSWELDSLEAIKQQLNQDVMTPSYIPKSYNLELIHANGETFDNIHQVVLTYSAENGIYIVIIEKAMDQLEPQGFEVVDINGAIGYLKSEGHGETLNTELQWVVGEYHYMINGTLTPEDVIIVANSFK